MRCANPLNPPFSHTEMGKPCQNMACLCVLVTTEVVCCLSEKERQEAVLLRKTRQENRQQNSGLAAEMSQSTT